MAFNHLMHARNIYREVTDFKKLSEDFPDLLPFLISGKNGRFRIDFQNPAALRTLTEALLNKDFGLSVKIPSDSLIPTVPQRLNYILWIEDLLTFLPPVEDILGIDVGTGPCCIFALLGAKKNGWNFIGTEVDEKSILLAEENVKSNNLQEKIKIVKAGEKILEEVCLCESRVFDFCMCNPPFFANVDDCGRKKKLLHVPKDQEKITEGGEVAFVCNMINESLVLKNKVRIFTSMLGKKQSLIEIVKVLKAKDLKYRWYEFCQGNTVRWGVAWTFLPLEKFSQSFKVCQKRKSAKKEDFTFDVPNDSQHYFEKLCLAIQSYLNELEISQKVLEKTETKMCFWITAYENTWTHLRRKRRAVSRQDLKSKSAKNSVYVQSQEEGGHGFNAVKQQSKEMEQSDRPFKEETNVHQHAHHSSASDFSEPVLDCKLFLECTSKTVAVRFCRSASQYSDAIYQLYQVFKNKFACLKK